MLKSYTAFSRSMGSENGAILVVAFSAKEAKKLAWSHCSDVSEWTDLGIRRIWEDKTGLLLADKEKVETETPHIVIDPVSCEACGIWGGGITKDFRCGYCDAWPGEKLCALLDVRFTPSRIKVLKFVKSNGPVDFIGILAWTGYTPDTITKVLAALLDLKLIKEVEVDEIVMVEIRP